MDLPTVYDLCIRLSRHNDRATVFGVKRRRTFRFRSDSAIEISSLLRYVKCEVKGRRVYELFPAVGLQGNHQPVIFHSHTSDFEHLTSLLLLFGDTDTP